MASNREFAEYVVDQLGGEEQVQYRKMFGEYGLWHNGLYFGTIEDDELYIKVTEEGAAMLPGATPVAPHGGKPGMFLVEELDDRGFLQELVRKTCEALPPPVKRAKKAKSRSEKSAAESDLHL